MNDFHDASRAVGNGVGVDLASAGFKRVDDSDGTEAVSPLQMNGLGFDNCVSLSVDIVHCCTAYSRQYKSR